MQRRLKDFGPRVGLEAYRLGQFNPKLNWTLEQGLTEDLRGKLEEVFLESLGGGLIDSFWAAVWERLPGKDAW